MDKPVRNGIITIVIIAALSAWACATITNGRGPIPPEYRR